ncbi:MAG: MgtC/SapB family protein [Flavobacterium sp.]|nr:MAG: MgtC/SapB family protein [Flavobacterium sp.]
MLEPVDICLRLGLAVLCGGLVGFERERKDWAVGIRTHMLACMGSSLVMMVSSFGFADILGTPNVSLDPSRIASSVIIGVGYLGAGIILILKPGNVKGLTTAAALWTTAGLGLACGGGLYFMAVAATIIMIAILYGMQIIQRKMELTSSRGKIVIMLYDEKQANEVIRKLTALPVTLSGISVTKKKKGCCIEAVIISSGKSQTAGLIPEFQSMPQVKKVFWN